MVRGEGALLGLYEVHYIITKEKQVFPRKGKCAGKVRRGESEDEVGAAWSLLLDLPESDDLQRGNGDVYWRSKWRK